MLKNYISISLRHLTRSKGYSMINILGLAVGMSVTMLIGMWVYDELSFNTYHKNYERIGQVSQHQSFNTEINTGPGPMALGPELKTVYKSDFKHVVMSWWESNHILSINDQKTSQYGTFMDGAVLDMLSFKMLQGSTNALKEPGSIVLSESAAKALFGDADPIDKLVRIDNAIDAKVTGVYEQLPHNSSFHDLQFISTWDLWVSSNFWMKADEHNWNSNINIFVELLPNTTFESVSAKIKDIKYKNIPKEEAARQNPQLFVQPMSRWHLFPTWKDGVESGTRMQFVWLFSVIGLFVLILACINFMNLSTAQSEKRAREVGIRKSIGSARLQLVYQFLTESFMVVSFAFVFAIAIVGISLPLFNDIADKRLSMPWSNLYFWAMSLGFIAITALLAGIYPAGYLSSFQPVKVLKGTFRAGRNAAIPRKVLVVLQFTVSIILIIGTIVVWQQVQYAKNRPIGYSREGLIMIRKNAADLWGKDEVLRNELIRAGAIVNMSGSSNPPTAVWFTDSQFSWRGKDPNVQTEFATMGVTLDYGKTMGWEFVSGRDYSREFATDSSAVILNETAAKLMAFDDPLNEEITWQGESNTLLKRKKLKVIGVIKDMIMGSPYEPVKQTIFYFDDRATIWFNMRLNPQLSTAESIAKIEKVFNDLFPAVPFEFKFTDQEYALKFFGEERIGRLANLFTTLAILISCLGLFGMSSFVAEQRRKEIGIRKVLGATVANLWKMLSWEFVSLVGISCIIGIPIAWIYLNQWLQKYEYHTDISVWVLVAASGGSMLITLLTVSFQTIKAAITDPVKSLRTE